MFSLLSSELLRKGQLPESCKVYMQSHPDAPMFRNCLESHGLEPR